MSIFDMGKNTTAAAGMPEATEGLTGESLSKAIKLLREAAPTVRVEFNFSDIIPYPTYCIIKTTEKILRYRPLFAQRPDDTPDKEVLLVTLGTAPEVDDRLRKRYADRGELIEKMGVAATALSEKNDDLEDTIADLRTKETELTEKVKELENQIETLGDELQEANDHNDMREAE